MGEKSDKNLFQHENEGEAQLSETPSINNVGQKSQKGTKKKKVTEPKINDVADWMIALEVGMKASKNVRVKQLYTLIIENSELKLDEGEINKLYSKLKELDREEQSRLFLHLKVEVETRKVTPNYLHQLITLLQADNCIPLTSKMLDNPDSLFKRMVDLFFDLHSPPNEPKLDDLYTFVRFVFIQLFDEQNRDYLTIASVEIMHFVSLLYNAVKEGKLPASKEKKKIKNSEESIPQTAKLMLDILDVKSNPTQLFQIVSLIRTIELYTFKAKNDSIESKNRLNQLEEEINSLKRTNQNLHRELNELKLETTSLSSKLLEKDNELKNLQSTIETESLRHKKLEQIVTIKLTDEKNRAIATVRKNIRYELSEMEEVLKNLKDDDNKRFLEYYINQINNHLN